MRRHAAPPVLGLALLVAAALATGGVTHAKWSDMRRSSSGVGATSWFSPYVPSECRGSLSDYNVVLGTESGETLNGTPQKDLIFGFGGDDIISGGNQADCLVGGDGNDTLGGVQQNENGPGDVLIGGTGDDTLNGGNGKDDLFGGPGDDDLFGGNGNDLLDGGEGDEDDGGDECDGGNGSNTLRNCEPDVEADSSGSRSAGPKNGKANKKTSAPSTHLTPTTPAIDDASPADQVVGDPIEGNGDPTGANGTSDGQGGPSHNSEDKEVTATLTEEATDEPTDEGGSDGPGSEEDEA